MNHDESKLPKWARDKLAELRREIKRLSTVEQAHAVLLNRDWYTIGLHCPQKFTLFRLDEDRASAICTVGAGAILLVGNERKKGGASEPKEPGAATI